MLQSCPAIRVFSAENMERGLEAAAKSFCSQEVCIEDNKVFSTFLTDFLVVPIVPLRG